MKNILSSKSLVGYGPRTHSIPGAFAGEPIMQMQRAIRVVLLAMCGLGAVGCGPEQGVPTPEQASSEPPGKVSLRPPRAQPGPEQETPGKKTAMGVAPDLSYLQVYAVGSANVSPYLYQMDPTSGGWEYTYGRAYTQYDHGGAWMEVVTYERGYANYQYATMNGTQVTPYESDPIWENGVLQGWIRYYDVSAWQSGTFYFQATSINNMQTWSDSLYIY